MSKMLEMPIVRLRISHSRIIWGKRTQVCFSKTTKDFVTGLNLQAKKTKYKIFLLRYESQRSINSILLKIPE